MNPEFCHGNRESIRYDGFKFWKLGSRGGRIECHSPYQVKHEGKITMPFIICRRCHIVLQAELWVDKWITRVQCKVFGFEYRMSYHETD